jgi:hypothetical protein
MENFETAELLTGRYEESAKHLLELKLMKTKSSFSHKS